MQRCIGLLQASGLGSLILGCSPRGMWFVPVCPGTCMISSSSMSLGELTSSSSSLVLPGVTFSEVRPAAGVAPMPREMAFPVPKGQEWHDLYDYIR